MSVLAAMLIVLASSQGQDRSRAHQKEGRWEEAASGYRELLETDPDFVPARIYLAEVLWLSGKVEEARTELSRARDQAPELLLPLLLLARIEGDESEELVSHIPDARTRAKLLANAVLEGDAFGPIERPG